MPSSFESYLFRVNINNQIKFFELKKNPVNYVKWNETIGFCNTFGNEHYYAFVI